MNAHQIFQYPISNPYTNCVSYASFEGAGYSFSKTADILTSLASDAMVEDGECVNAVEIFWTPSDEEEVLTKNDIVMDFPELIDL